MYPCQVSDWNSRGGGIAGGGVMRKDMPEFAEPCGRMKL